MLQDTAQSTVATVTVILPAALMRLFPGCQGRLEIAASDIAGMLDKLEARWPGMRDRLRDSTPSIRRHISIFVDGRRSRLDTPLRPGATVYVLTAMSGG